MHGFGLAHVTSTQYQRRYFSAYNEDTRIMRLYDASIRGPRQSGGGRLVKGSERPTTICMGWEAGGGSKVDCLDGCVSARLDSLYAQVAYAHK